MSNCLIAGASGAIGGAMVARLCAREDTDTVFALSRSGRMPDFDGPGRARITPLAVDLTDEASLEKAASAVAAGGPLRLCVLATGILHDGGVQPEKSVRDLSLVAFEKIFAVNTAGPALAAKHFLPLMAGDGPAHFAALSARVGSISDNRLGGWYAYRASKAALNMVIRCLAIEWGRRHQNVVIAGLHPGTVDSALSKPFQRNVPPGKLFTPEKTAGALLEVLEGLRPEHSGRCFAWDGKEIPA